MLSAHLPSAAPFPEWRGLRVDAFLGSILAVGAMVPPSGSAGGYLQSGCLLGEVCGRDVFPKGPPGGNRRLLCRAGDLRTWTTRGNQGWPAGSAALGSSPGGVLCGAAHWGARSSSLANVSVHFITTWFGKMEIPVAAYLAPISQLSPRGLCSVLL